MRQMFSMVILMVSISLFANEIKVPKRVDIAISKDKLAMILMDINHTKKIGNEIFKWIQPFYQVGDQKLAKAANLEKKQAS